MPMNSICQYAQHKFHLSSCVLKESCIIQENLINPFAATMLHDFLSSELSSTNKPLIHSIDHFSKYYCMPCKSDNTLYIWGPILKVTFNDVAFTNYLEKYHVRKSQTREFSEYLYSLPAFNTEDDIRIIKLLYGILNDTRPDSESIFLVDSNEKRVKQVAHKIYSQSLNATPPNDGRHDASYTYHLLFQLIQEGNPERLSKELNDQKHFLHYGPSQSPLTNYRNTAIIAIALASNAGIAGGMDFIIATQLIDMYLVCLETLTDIDDILTLVAIVFMDFATRVKNSKIPGNLPPVLQNIIGYIQANPEKKLTERLLADKYGINASYLSKVFSKHMGMPLGSFITKNKISEAKRLLSDTSMTISDISYHLAFSSQSHFHKVFKTETGMTPFEYKKKHYHLQ